jgi:hypothetical protein
MAGMTAALSVAPGLAGAELGEYRVGYISQDGMRHQVSLADAQAVRFEVMSPARRFATRKGQRHLPGLWDPAAGEHLRTLSSRPPRSLMAPAPRSSDFRPGCAGRLRRGPRRR